MHLRTSEGNADCIILVWINSLISQVVSESRGQGSNQVLDVLPKGISRTNISFQIIFMGSTMFFNKSYMQLPWTTLPLALRGEAQQSGEDM